MAEELIESYLGNIYIWRVSKKEIDGTHDKVLAKISKMNEVLVNQLFEIPADSFEVFKKNLKFYRNELKMIIPNVPIAKDQMNQKLFGKFYKVKSSLIDFNVDSVHLILQSLKSQLIYTEKIPKILSSDLILSEKEALFKENVLKLKTLTVELLHKQVIKNFQEFFKVTKEEFSEYALVKIKEILHNFSGKIQDFRSKVTKKLLKYLNGLVVVQRLVSIEIQIKKIDEESAAISPSWEIVHKGLLLTEELKLIQVIKTSSVQSLILIKLLDSNLNLIILLENYISRRIQKVCNVDFDFFIPGSVPELMLFYSNRQRMMWKGQLIEHELIQQESINFFKADEKIVSSFLIKHQHRIIYVTHSGGVSNFSLKGSEKLDMSSIYPQKYTKVTVSDCERFIFLISSSSFNIFNSNMQVITFHKVYPVFLQIKKETLKILARGDEGFLYKTFSIAANVNDSRPDTGMKMEKAKLLTRMTFEFGKQMIKEMFTSNKFEGDIEEKKDVE